VISRPDDIAGGQHAEDSDARRFWTVADLLAWTEGYFQRLGMATPRLDAELLLAHAMGSSRLELYTGYRKVVEPAERARFRALVERRARYEPVAYILGEREFYSLSFEVTPAVLVPRPETEMLVDRLLEELPGGASPPAPRVLDLGIGSGNIAIAFLVNRPEARAVGVDVSAAALEVARRNAVRHGVAERLELLEGDLWAPLGPPPSCWGPFDAVVSNPPYIAPREHAGLMRDVRDHEPQPALLDHKGEDGLGYYRAIARAAGSYLAPGGLLALELGAGQARQVQEILAGCGWHDLRLHSDYAGIPRVLAARRGLPGS
jgi:release factor glutamine methyltransferase